MVQVKHAPAGVEIKTDEIKVADIAKPTILIVEDQERTREATLRTLKSMSKDCEFEAPDQDGFLDLIRGETRNDILLIILDVELDRGWSIHDHSFHYLDGLRKVCPNAEILVYSGKMHHAILAISREYEGFNYIQKPSRRELRTKTAELVSAAFAEMNDG